MADLRETLEAARRALVEPPSMRSGPISGDDVDEVERFKGARATIDEALAREAAGDRHAAVNLAKRAEEELMALADVRLDDLDASQLEGARQEALRHLGSLPAPI
jgi:hypothetical protein